MDQKTDQNWTPDFFRIRVSETESKRDGIIVTIEADYNVSDTKDIMTRGHEFYAVWDEERKFWSKDENDVCRIVDSVLWKKKEELENKYKKKGKEVKFIVKDLKYTKSNAWREYRNYITSVPDNYTPLNKKLIFSDTPPSRDNYATCRLNYSLSQGDTSAYDELMDTLYDPAERQKIEWAIGSVYSGDSKWIQKFLVFYGEAGSGKSTVLNIIQKLFEGYYTVFEAKSLVGNINAFATEMFRSDPLVAIQHDGDLSKIEDNTKLNSIVSHETMVINEKYTKGYCSTIEAFLFMGTNRPVKITDAKSGITRRLIDVTPSGRKLSFSKYQELTKAIEFELGAIGKHCLDVYLSMGPDYYNTYVPTEMMYKTDPFFNFVESCYYAFRDAPYVTLSQAYDMYKQYCSENGNSTVMLRYLFREELKNYFSRFYNVTRIDGKQVRSVYLNFKENKFIEMSSFEQDDQDEVHDGDHSLDSISSDSNNTLCTGWIKLEHQKSLIDDVYSDCPAQYATKEGKPAKPWKDISTTLQSLDTTEVHYVKVPQKHIVIDFDIRGKDGEKSLQECLSEATKWPRTYVEVSRGGKGLHLHYIYAGDVTELSSVYSDGVEIKVFTGGSSLRRKLTLCNDIPIATLTSGLPIKEKKMLNFKRIEDEKHLRALIEKNLEKDIHNATKPSVDFIYKLLEEAYESGITYDVMDMWSSIYAFAMHSTNQKNTCLALVRKMHFRSKDIEEVVSAAPAEDTEVYIYDAEQDRARCLPDTITDRDWSKYENEPIVFFDVEVFKNLLVVVWKKIGAGNPFVRMINPSPTEVESLLKMKLVGFNNRKYDNHILYARYLGWSLYDIYTLGQRIINAKKDDNNGLFPPAYNASYADIYDYVSEKQSLKKFEIEYEQKYPELGLAHEELPIPWDEEVPQDRWDEVASYCENDVRATEAVYNERTEDLVVRQVMAELSKLTINHSTRQHSTKIMFGDDKNPQSQFVYTDLSKMFPGYKYELGKSTYRGEEVGEGGYAYAEPGIYYNVALLDIASMHPSSIIALNLFGDKYTARFKEIVEARLCIKHGDDEKAKTLLGGLLTPFIDRIGVDISRKTLAGALKLVINSIYGYTAAKFDNPFRDKRNVDNIVAKRGALFMVNLKHEVQERGFTVAHIKTDSIKIPNATPEIIQFVMDYGKQYGYNFEHEATYDRMCLINKAVYICKYADYENSGNDELIANHGWSATGEQFMVPYVFKNLFSKNPITLDDMCETKTVKDASMYLDFNEQLNEGDHDYRFVGRVGNFCPIESGYGAGELVVLRKGKYDAVNGTKGYRWLESSVVRGTDYEKHVDRRYYNRLVDEAKEAISKYGDFEMFTEDEDVELPF